MSPDVRSHRSHIEACGRQLQVQRLEPPGARSAPVLVFLHEGLGSIDQWKDFPARLCAATGSPGLVYDRWGFGGSQALDGPRDPGYLHHEARESLPAVLAACGVDDPLLVGHSDGGSIALLFAAAYPDRARAIVTEAAHVFVECVTLAGIRAAARAYRDTDLRERLGRYHGPKTDLVFNGWADTWLGPGFRDWNIEAELPRIRCPALVIQGEDDEYGTPAQVEAIARGVSGPVCTWMVPRCGHVPHRQAAQAVLESMARFIGAHSTPAPERL